MPDFFSCNHNARNCLVCDWLKADRAARTVPPNLVYAVDETRKKRIFWRILLEREDSYWF